MGTNASTDTCAEDSTFTPLGVVEERVRRQDRARARTGYVVYRGTTGFEVAVPETILERIRLFGERAAPGEWYGILVGRLYDDATGRHVVVVGAVPDPDAEASPGFVRTCFDSELRTRTSASLLYPDGVPVGWVHGHVRFGARYSPTDFRNQATWTQPHSIGIVVDPFIEPGLGVYRGPEAELLERVATDFPEATTTTRETRSECKAVHREGDSEVEVPRIPHRVRRIMRGFVVAGLLTALLAAGLLLGLRSAGHEDQIDHINRRLADLEEAWARYAVHPTTPEPEGVTEAAVSPDAGASVECSTP